MMRSPTPAQTEPQDTATDPGPLPAGGQGRKRLRRVSVSEILDLMSRAAKEDRNGPARA